SPIVASQNWINIVFKLLKVIEFKIKRNNLNIINVNMVKRCSAKNCYNSQLTHKIAYFGYPKNEIAARKWAKLAGREDILNKKLDNITKYYLCSDHFSSDAFSNPETEDKSYLRLNKTFSIPIPTIFKDNLMENVKSVVEHPEKFQKYSRNTAGDKTIKSIKRSNRTSSLKKSSTTPEKLKFNYNVGEKKPQELTFEEEVVEEYLDYTYEEIDIKREDSDESYCRLCAKNVNNLTLIFQDDGDFYPCTDCLRLLPMIQKDDGLPQYVCMECLEKLQSCADTLNGFVLNQNLFCV
ncbi:CLUMA_CG005969, isoform A, partial [Clunio marinus]